MLLQQAALLVLLLPQLQVSRLNHWVATLLTTLPLGRCLALVTPLSPASPCLKILAAFQSGIAALLSLLPWTQ
jgi:hypothetical protein